MDSEHPNLSVTDVFVPENYRWEGEILRERTILNDSADEIIFESPTLCSASLLNMAEMRKSGQFCDMTIKVADQLFSVHRLVLCSSIPFFRTMFCTNKKESQQNLVMIQGIDVTTFKIILDFIYTGHVKINRENVMSLIFGTSFFQLIEVMNACGNFLANWLSPHNVFYMKQIGEDIACSPLLNAADKYILKYFYDLTVKKEFLSLPAEPLIKLVKNKELYVRSEEQLFEAIMQWVEVDIKSRTVYLRKLLEGVRRPLLNRTYFFIRIFTNPLIKSNGECRELIDDTWELYTGTKRRKISYSETRSRCDPYSICISPYFVADGLWNNDDSRSEAIISFHVKHKNTSLVEDTSEVIVRNLSWKFVLCCKGGVPVSLEIQCPEISKCIECFACYKWRIVPQKEGVRASFYKSSFHLFNSTEKNWHVKDTVNARDCEKFLLSFAGDYIKDDTFIFQVHIVVHSVHGTDWNSKKYTNFVGFKSQENSYIHSLLHTLYFIRHFRKEVKEYPSENSDDTLILPSLQNIFNLLESNDEPVDLKRTLSTLNIDFVKVTKRKKYRTKTNQENKLKAHFDWERLCDIDLADVFLEKILEHLIQNVISDSLKSAVSKLFEGRMEVITKCKNVDCELRKEESFFYLQLNVSTCRNVYESLQDLTAVQNLGSSYKISTTDHGLQAAEKTIEFLYFPTVLFLSLPRFEFNETTGGYLKRNSWYTFYEKICLNYFLKIPDPTPVNYALFAVLVHSGEDEEGSYMVFINPKGNGEWYKFDQEVVSKCSKQEAIDFNFGFEDTTDLWYLRPNTSAYMLVYISDKELKNVLMV